MLKIALDAKLKIPNMTEIHNSILKDGEIFPCKVNIDLHKKCIKQVWDFNKSYI